MVDNTFVTFDNPGPATNNLRASVFKTLNLQPSPNGNCQTINSLMTSACLPLAAKVLHNQVGTLPAMELTTGPSTCQRRSSERKENGTEVSQGAVSFLVQISGLNQQPSAC